MSDKPNIILFDIETLPNLTEVMKVYPKLSDYPGLTLKASITSIISFGFKPLSQGRAQCVSVWRESRWRGDLNDDQWLVKRAYEVLSKADCVVTHNGKRFDWKFLQTRLLYHGLPPLPPILHIDTCQEAKKNLMVFNNRLNTVSEFLTGKKKLENGGWDLWVRVANKDKKAFELMERYCKRDVEVLEGVFKKLRPFMKGLPNHNLFATSGPVCGNCGSRKLTKNGFRFSGNKKFQRLTCHDCYSHTKVAL